MKLKQLLFASTFFFGFAIASLAQMTTAKTTNNDVLFVLCAEISDLDTPEEQVDRIDAEIFTFFSFEKEEGVKNKVMKVKMNAKKNLEDLDPNLIEKINVYKKEEDLKRFKASDAAGIVEIYLKSEKDFWHLITQ